MHRWITPLLVLAAAACSSMGLAEERPSTTVKSSTVDELLETFASSAYPAQQGEIARKIIALGDKSAIPKMLVHLDSPKRGERCNAALVLDGLGDERGLPIIISELEDKEPRPTTLKRSDGRPYPEGQIIQDRYYAASLLGQIKKKEAVPALVRTTTDKALSDIAAISLGDIGDKSAIPALRKMSEDFPDRRLWAGYGLAALGEPDGFEILTTVAVSNSVWTERRHAVEALGKIGNSKAVPTVVKALKDQHINVRVSAARALGMIGDPAALLALTEALDDPSATKVNAPTTVAREAKKAIEVIKAKMK